MKFEDIFKQIVDQLPIMDTYMYQMVVGKKGGKYAIIVKEGDDIKYRAKLNKETRFISQILSSYGYYKRMGIKIKIHNSVKLIFKENEELHKVKESPRRVSF